jgi:hypothetical protein
MACTGACSAVVQDDFDDFTKYTVSTADTHASVDSDDSNVLNTSYQRATPLFKAIEKENWEGILHFLTNGRWNNSLFFSTNDHLKSPSPEIQTKTWVTSYDSSGIPEWSQLPLHAAISYSAPFVIIRKLVEIYPKSIQCTDNEGMLPIHLAFGFGASEPVLGLLLEPFPMAVNERGLGGRFPYECCELGPNKVRGKVYRIVSEQITTRVRADNDKDWRDFCNAAKQTVGLEQPFDVSNKKLTEVLLELLHDRKELNDIKMQKSSTSGSKNSTKQGRGVGRMAGGFSPRAKKYYM